MGIWCSIKRRNGIPTWNLFGLEVNKIGYQGQVLPVLFASWILAKIELFLRKRVWDSITFTCRST